MKKETLLIAFGMGFLLFVIRTQLKSESISNLFQMQLITLAGIGFGMKRHYAKIRLLAPEFKITYGNAFWLGLRICFIAAFLSGLLYFFIPLNSFQVYESSKFLRSCDVVISTIICGVVLTAIYSWYIVYRNL